jgi:hypothetical protein
MSASASWKGVLPTKNSIVIIKWIRSSKGTQNDGSSQLVLLEIENVVQHLRKINPNQTYIVYPIVCEGINEN